jgi:hypothetical protein
MDASLRDGSCSWMSRAENDMPGDLAKDVGFESKYEGNQRASRLTEQSSGTGGYQA